jgi:hypothetical protein
MMILESNVPNSMDNDIHTPLIRNNNIGQFQSNQGGGNMTSKYVRHGPSNSMISSNNGAGRIENVSGSGTNIMPPINSNQYQYNNINSSMNGGSNNNASNNGNNNFTYNRLRSIDNDGSGNGTGSVLNNHNGFNNSNINNIKSNIYLN